MSYRTVNFGATRAGLATVGYKLQAADLSLGSRITTGVAEVGTDTGVYGASVDESSNPISILWDSGETSPVYAAESIDAAQVPDPDDPSYVVGYLDCFGGSHELVAGVVVEFRFRDTEASAESHPGRPFGAKSPASGRLTCNFRPSTDYEGRRENGAWVAFTSASSGTFALPGILGGE